MGFDFARDAGAFALELTDMIQKGKPDWLREGLYWEEHLAGNPEPVKHPLNIRVGLHTGECEVRGNDLGGLAVHIAARVGAMADPGEVMVSRTVKDLVAGSGIEFVDRGEHELKGVPGTWKLFAARN